MNRTQYLTKPVITQFIEWLAVNLNNGTFSHGYIDRRSRQPWCCAGLADAFTQYKWSHGPYRTLSKGSTAASNDAILKALKSDLDRALSPSLNDQSACNAAKEVMIWGGVRNGNISWLETHKQGLAGQLVSIRDLLDAGDLKSLAAHNKIIRFNAGMTKIYSLIAKDFIIYDSRVAAALGWAVTKFCAGQFSTIPAELAFPWAPAKEARGAPNPKRRNPSTGNLIFPRLGQGKHHAQWNLKASWILQAVLDNLSECGNPLNSPGPIAPLRRIEAALFMIGYDLPPLATGPSAPATTNDTTKKRAQEESENWNDAYTPTQGNHFRYRLTKKGIKVEKGLSFSLAEIGSTINWLWRHFDKTAFPLENSRSKWRAGELRPGLGLAYINATNRSPMHASRLAALLLDIGVIHTVEGSRKWVLDPQLLEADVLDINKLWVTVLDREDAE
ncbi:hypothetical protein [Pseudomonas frederiksbergensis]|uniref:hypothetical protein n=1 Tax=Pseudomonas frederiksbergensis TaxID=104087 RepID=UPI0015E2A69B|nr:hypothetical protein [Pseudomonas frederiksbergensis]